jgi:hypothetical protein
MRGAALAFEGFDEGGFFAAHVGAGAQVDLDVEVEARPAEDAVPSRPAARRRASTASSCGSR